LPEFRRVALTDIDEPQLAARVAMDEEKLAELMQSMQEIGLIQPIILKPAAGRFEIEAGHRRFVAASRLGWAAINALVFSEGEIAVGAAMLAENTMREDLSAAEEAILFQEARERYGLDEAALCARFHVQPNYLADRMRLLRDDPEVFRAILERRIAFSVGRELNKCPDQEMRRYFLDAAIRGETGARVVAQWIRDWRASSLPPQPSSQPAAVPTVESNSEPHRIECVICGGHKDPYNLVTVQIHKWELEQILTAVNTPKEG